jgi:choline dehydrogenase
LNILFVISVGGGTAGCVLASRLSENPKVTVLLIEAGGIPSGWTGLLSRIPIMAPLLHKSKADWAYMSAPQKNAFRALKNNVRSNVHIYFTQNENLPLK